MDLDDAASAALLHPLVAEAGPSQDKPGMLALTLITGEEVNCNPQLAEPEPGESAEAATQRFHAALDQLIVTVQTALEAEIDIDKAIPCVRNAAYFTREKPPVMTFALTDYIGVGLAIDLPAAVLPLGPDKFEGETQEQTMYRAANAVINLRELAEGIGLAQVFDDGSVLAIDATPGNEAAWFADIETMQKILGLLRETTGTEWAIIPAGREDLFAVNTATDRWDELLDILEAIRPSHKVVFPYPHVPVDDTWREWLPPAGAPCEERLTKLRVDLHAELHAPDQVTGGYPAKMLLIHRDGPWRSAAVISDQVTSIPRTDLVVFFDEGEEEPLGVPLATAQVLCPHLFSSDAGTFPPRLLVQPPSAEDRRVLADERVAWS